MAGCSFYAHGHAAALDAFLASAPGLPARTRSRRSEPPSYFSVPVSGPDDAGLEAQVAAALAFLETHWGDLTRLATLPGVSDRRLFFGFYALTRTASGLHRYYLPPALLRAAASLEVGVELSWLELPGSVSPA